MGQWGSGAVRDVLIEPPLSNSHACDFTSRLSGLTLTPISLAKTPILELSISQTAHDRRLA